MDQEEERRACTILVKDIRRMPMATPIDRAVIDRLLRDFVETLSTSDARVHYEDYFRSLRKALFAQYEQPQIGWICPKCNVGVNPIRSTCPCEPEL